MVDGRESLGRPAGCLAAALDRAAPEWPWVARGQGRRIRGPAYLSVAARMEFHRAGGGHGDLILPSL
jgi:hypothetical protein